MSGWVHLDLRWQLGLLERVLQHGLVIRALLVVILGNGNQERRLRRSREQMRTVWACRVIDEPAAEKAWTRLLALYSKALA